MRLQAGDRIATGHKGRIGLELNDGTRRAVGPGQYTKVPVPGDRDEFVTRRDRGSLGEVSEKIAKSGREAMRVRTPTSALGARG